jgi:hypothetical protein
MDDRDCILHLWYEISPTKVLKWQPFPVILKLFFYLYVFILAGLFWPLLLLRSPADLNVYDKAILNETARVNMKEANKILMKHSMKGLLLHILIVISNFALLFF